MMMIFKNYLFDVDGRSVKNLNDAKNVTILVLIISSDDSSTFCQQWIISTASLGFSVEAKHKQIEE